MFSPWKSLAISTVVNRLPEFSILPNKECENDAEDRPMFQAKQMQTPHTESTITLTVAIFIKNLSVFCVSECIKFLC
jgi:hypothetical protein